MISVAEAKNIIINNCINTNKIVVPIVNSFGKVLAEDIYSCIDIPNFPQSSMDGYAFNFEGYQQHKILKIVDIVAAGDEKTFSINKNEAVRIFTGAPLPAGADTVIMQEKVTATNDILFISDSTIIKGNSVREKAAEIKSGDLALGKNCLLTAASIGFLASIGIAEIAIYKPPVISIIVTGNELQQPGKSLKYGQVYESNSFTLTAALTAAGINEINTLFAKDDLTELTKILKIALEKSDIILLTGGVSVGDYDFVIKASENCGIKKLFHKIKQKPGKPIFFGKKNDKIIFGLPGNPSSVLTCFYQYVLLALTSLNANNKLLQQMEVALAAAIYKPKGLTHFLKGFYDGNTVTALTGQESYRMISFAKANCLIEVDEDDTQKNSGDLVKIYLLPTY
jgi:molybdopterin molybdotransferase